MISIVECAGCHAGVGLADKPPGAGSDWHLPPVGTLPNSFIMSHFLAYCLIKIPRAPIPERGALALHCLTAASIALRFLAKHAFSRTCASFCLDPALRVCENYTSHTLDSNLGFFATLSSY